MKTVTVDRLEKRYPSFLLDSVSFSLEEGHITGFVGRNGAGKTTTVKAMLNLIHPDGGEVTYFGTPLSGNESEIKKLIGYSTGTVSWYPRKRIRDISRTVSGFYGAWDEAAYEGYLRLFGLDGSKTPSELSEGMKVKLNLALALSHGAKVLILDEPTSGLDPFSRDELTDVFRGLSDGGVTVFFSTHIVSDLERCADDLIYISGGRIVCSAPLNEFRTGYGLSGETLEETILRMERSRKDA